jgi:hypothetical protein
MIWILFDMLKTKYYYEILVSCNLLTNNWIRTMTSTRKIQSKQTGPWHKGTKESPHLWSVWDYIAFPPQQCWPGRHTKVKHKHLHDRSSNLKKVRDGSIQWIPGNHEQDISRFPWAMKISGSIKMRQRLNKYYWLSLFF